VLRKAAGKMRGVKLGHAWESWLEMLQLQQRRRAGLARALGHRRLAGMGMAWRSWRGLVASKREKRSISNRWA
jgi:hypothetical protein